MSPHQAKFDEVYISSSEICRRFRVSRAAISYAQKRGILPEPIVVEGQGLQLWVRDEVKTNLDAWELMLKVRRGEMK